jgi:PPOX class probable F420-dependent enzyme
MSETIPSAAHHLLDDVNFAHVVTLMHDGTPQTTPVWIARDGDVAYFNTAKGRAKYHNLQRDPRVALSVHQHDQPYEWVQIRGRAELEDDPEAAVIHELSRKYTGRDYQNLRPGEERVTVRVIPDRVVYPSGG